MMEQDHTSRLVILIPVFNDWSAVAMLLPALDHALKDCGTRVEILLVNDGSTQPLQPALLAQHFEHLHSVQILHLRRNLGHQRAIAVGLVHIHTNLPCAAVVVMDGDGEDRPRDVPRLIDEYRRHGQRTIIFAERAKRLEKIGFRLSYWLYRTSHWLLTGVRVRVGNFSILPWQAVERLVIVSEIWNHYAAAIIRARLPYLTVPMDRGRRMTGESKMNFVALLVHGFSSISVFSDVVSTRLLVAASALTALLAALTVTVAVVSWSAHLVVPFWAACVCGVSLLILTQAVIGSFLLAFTILSARVNMSLVPVRDTPQFVDRLERVFPRDKLSLPRLRAEAV
jgi:glycosyltransferase involved in cell wall biosynthesis